MTPIELKEYREWLETRPQIIKDLAEAYPPGEYRIKENAPYSISCPGTRVFLEGYREDGQVIVVIRAEDKLQDALDSETLLALEHGKFHEIEKIHGSNVIVRIDPVWLKLEKNHLVLDTKFN